MPKAPLAFVAGSLMLCVSCSTAPQQPAAPEKPAEAVTGRHAFQQVYPSARIWAADAQPFRMASINLDQPKSADGKAGAWQVTFVSPSRSASRTWSYSVVEAPGNLHQGVFAGPEEGWAPARGQAAQPFQLAGLKFDSDEAYKVALEHAADYLKKNSGKPVQLLLEYSNRFPDLAWRVMWGESVATSEYSVFVDATTGKFLERVAG